MKKKYLVLLSILISSFVYSQSSEFDFLSNELCSKFTKDDLTLNKLELAQLVKKKHEEVNQENEKYISELTKKLKAKSTGKTSLLISKKVILNLQITTINNCPVYSKISQKLTLVNNESTKESVKMISKKTCVSIADYKNVNNSDLNKIVETIIFDLVFENETLIQKDYGKNLKSFYSDLNGELMANCDRFFKMAMNNLQPQ